MYGHEGGMGKLYCQLQRERACVCEGGADSVDKVPILRKAKSAWWFYSADSH